MKNAIAGLALAGALSAAYAQDPDRGKLLYENNCLTCHYERIHKRDASKSLVKSYPELRTQVARWAGQAKQSLTPQDIDDIAEYLNRSHYKLDK
jgi:mono/diheme cytochrome c family protein